MRSSKVLGSFKTALINFFDNFWGLQLDFWPSKLIFQVTFVWILCTKSQFQVELFLYFRPGKSNISYRNNYANRGRTKRCNHFFSLSREIENKISLKTSKFPNFLHALAEIMLMKHGSCFKSRNYAVRSFLVL